MRKDGTPGRIARKDPRTDRLDGLTPCEWKLSFDTWVDAEAACWRLYDDTGQVTWAYVCEKCNRYHGSKFTGFPTYRNYFEWYRGTLRKSYPVAEDGTIQAGSAPGFIAKPHERL